MTRGASMAIKSLKPSKTRSRKLKKVWMSQQSELPDRLTPAFDIALSYYLFGCSGRQFVDLFLITG